MVGEDANEKEEMSRKPVHIFSTLRDAQPGNYTCLAGESSTSITVESKPITGHPLTPVVVILVVCTSFLLLYLWRRYHTMKAEDRGLTMSMAGLEYCSMAPGDITVGVMSTDGNCMGVEQTYQPPADSEYGPGTGLYPQTFANWSQDEKAPGTPQTEASNGSLLVQPNKIVPPRAPKWSPATQGSLFVILPPPGRQLEIRFFHPHQLKIRFFHYHQLKIRFFHYHQLKMTFVVSPTEN